MLAARKLIFLPLLGAGLLWAAPPGRAIDLAAAGSWSQTIDAGDLVGGAGSALTASYESAQDQVSLSIQNTTANDDSWRVDVHRLDINWPPACNLSLRRTGDGVGLGAILGGDSYQVISTSDAALFSGAGDRNGVDLQLKLDGLSIQVAPGTYSTTVICTLIDT
jgi:hypothetical protein